MTDVTSQSLPKKTKRSLKVIDPKWLEIMAKVWDAQEDPGAKRANPVLKERQARNYAARLRTRASARKTAIKRGAWFSEKLIAKVLDERAQCAQNPRVHFFGS